MPTTEIISSIEGRIKSAIRDVPDFPKPGILFRDITPVLSDPALCRELEKEFARAVSNFQVDAVAGIESRGFLFGMGLAQRLNVPFIPVRKKGKLPYKTVSYEYDLEYGSAIIEMHTDAITVGMNVLIHDDLLATGGTAAATAELVQMQKANVSCFAFLIELSFLDGRKSLEKYTREIISLANYQ
ncbi:MAG TPA: adenine phosphoribosyltransferase [Bacteroidia bacterium]|nr:adenine phosphoribosyltransferase [Bacteroidia bacterium]